MPAKSKAQFKEMFVLYKQGKITKKQLDDFTAKGNVDFKKLPPKVKPKVRIRGKKPKGK